MTEKEEYTTIQLEPKDEAQRLAILVLMQEGALRERERTNEILKTHGQTTKSAGGFLGVCTCGEAIDDYREHLLALINGENK